MSGDAKSAVWRECVRCGKRKKLNDYSRLRDGTRRTVCRVCHQWMVRERRKALAAELSELGQRPGDSSGGRHRRAGHNHADATRQAAERALMLECAARDLELGEPEWDAMCTAVCSAVDLLWSARVPARLVAEVEVRPACVAHGPAKEILNSEF